MAAEAFVPRHQSPAPPPLKIVAFRRARDFQRIFEVRQIAGFMQSGLERHTLVFGPDARGSVANQTAFHEYTHYLMRSRQGINFPVWYEEGFASLLSTMRIGDDAVTVGYVPERVLEEVRLPRMSVRDLLDERYELDWARHDLMRLYARAWLFAHMLHFGHLAGLPPYHEGIPAMLDNVDTGMSAAQAMEEALGAGTETLQRQLRQYARRRGLPTQRLPVPAAEPDVSDDGCLAETDVRQELAMAAVSRNPKYARDLFARILESDPDHVDALVGLSLTEDDPRGARDVVDRALAIEPGHSAANVRMGEVKVAECRGSTAAECLGAWDEGARHYRLALRSQPDSVGAAYGLGVVYLHTGQAGDAVNYLRVAYRRAPWAPPFNFYLGSEYRFPGSRERPRTHLTKPIHWDPHQRRRERASMALALLGP
ncbi:MAG: tetratricopeptide repeat protein [Gammaproteobacteria bacterium]|nr:tetratricopeptide repeat protein [Gammaproteobacteria bacterium]